MSTPVSSPPIARSLKDVFNAVDPTLPLPSGDRRYVDCTEVRGNEDVVSQMFRIIWWTDKPATAQLFTGHRGCGKSTELFRLRQRLQDAGYAVIYFEADEIIDVEDIVYSDVLVAIARQVYHGLLELQVPLPEELLNDVFAWFAEVVYEQKNVREFQAALAAEFGFGLPQVLTPLAQLMAKITGQLRTGVESRKEIRRKLDPQIAQLIDRINLLIQTGTAALRGQGKQGLVIMVDNLDRIPFRKLDETRNNHDALYIEHGEQLRSLRCHLIYTVPIAILYSPRAKILTNIFPDCLTLPMIKVSTQDNQPWPAGLAKMRQILAERIELDTVFEEQALDLLCAESGGHPRILMTLVRYACQYATNREVRPIDANAAERAIGRLTSEYSRSIPEEHFPALAAVFKTKRCKNDDDHRLMLHNLSVLEYMNGLEPWHDVHPSVRRLSKFRESAGNG
ncbi:MAG: AAA family ATPase [Caldilineales bacterium]|nr:AAA family ATPase [Caldilineales bacterium]MDW8319687.1 AAA family ATPase [Anaerolineae bacterium]